MRNWSPARLPAISRAREKSLPSIRLAARTRWRHQHRKRTSAALMQQPCIAASKARSKVVPAADSSGRGRTFVALPAIGFAHKRPHADTPRPGGCARALNADTRSRNRRQSEVLRLPASAPRPCRLSALRSTTGKIPAGHLAARKEQSLAGHNPNKSQAFPVKEPNGSRNLPVRFFSLGGKACSAWGSSNRVPEKTLDRQR